jgi:hypothetical protein
MTMDTDTNIAMGTNMHTDKYISQEHVNEKGIGSYLIQEI